VDSLSPSPSSSSSSPLPASHSFSSSTTSPIPLVTLILQELRIAGENGLSFLEIWMKWVSESSRISSIHNSSSSSTISSDKGEPFLLSSRNEVAHALGKLCSNSDVSCVLSYDHHRYVLATPLFLRKWVIPRGVDQWICPRPWIGVDLIPKKERVLAFFWKLLRGIWKSPGISREELTKKVRRSIFDCHLFSIISSVSSNKPHSCL
jgi:hypothetical protein